MQKQTDLVSTSSKNAYGLPTQSVAKHINKQQASVRKKKKRREETTSAHSLPGCFTDTFTTEGPDTVFPG